jgi:hypothetical protein
MKVFVITTGFYDEVTAIFDNRELAEKIASNTHEARVQEWLLNDTSKITAGEYKLSCYYIDMEKDGEIITIAAQDSLNIDLLMEYYLYISDDMLTGYILAENKEQAIKIANEKRLKLIANNEWK